MDYYEAKSSEYEGWIIATKLKCPVCNSIGEKDTVLFQPYPLFAGSDLDTLVCQECNLHFTNQQLKDLTKDDNFPCMSILGECRKLLSGGKQISRRKNGLFIL